LGHSILNVEGICALACLIAITIRARRPPDNSSIAAESSWSAALLVAIAGVIPFLRALFFPLLHDSYDLVTFANESTWPQTLNLFRSPATVDPFFRPLAHFAFFLYAKGAHYKPLWWHAFSICGHGINTALIYVLLRKLGLGRTACFFGALLFAWHGTRPEAVAWVATRVDIMSTLFALITLLLVLNYIRRNNRYALAVACLAAVCAVLSKEAAFSLPLLILAVFPFCPHVRRNLISFVFVGATCGALFLYRWHVVHGIGGYTTISGAPTALQLNLLKTIDGLLYRQWAIAFFPVNWSQPGTLVWTGLVFCAVALAATLSGRPADRKLLLAAIAFMIFAALPAQHLLLIGSDLNGARVLYLPVIGFALLWAVILNAQSMKRQVIIAAALLTFELCVLTHNMNIWRHVAEASQRACSFIADEVVRDPTPVAIDPLPAKWKGVFFLANGFPPCVKLNSRGRLTSTPVFTSSPKNRRYRWDEKTESMQRVP
jgi:hypothetical protein